MIPKNVLSHRWLLCAVSLILLVEESFGWDLRDRSNHADYLIVAPTAYIATAETLASFRSAHDGYATMVVPVESVLVQFSGSGASDFALRDFLRYALTQWSAPRPRYVLLAGNINRIPVHVERVDLGRPTDSAMVDYWFVAAEAQPGGPPKPMAAIGRFPAWDLSGLSTMVRKTIDYESANGGAWSNKILSLVDASAPEATSFTRDASLLRRILSCGWPDTVVVTNKPESPLYKKPEEFRAEWNAGAGIMLYNGHGSTTTLSDVGYFSTWSVDSLSNRDRLSICFIGACNQRFEPRTPSSIPVRLLESANGGAVAVVGPGGLSFENQNSVFLQAMFDNMTKESVWRLGDCFRLAMSGLLFGAWMDSVVHRMNYLGDPALMVKRRTDALSVRGQKNMHPAMAELAQNYPNPFNPFTTIKYTVGVAGGKWQVAGEAGAGPSTPSQETLGRSGSRPDGRETRKTSLVVYDVLGRQVATLVDEVKAPGSYEVKFDGSGLSSGVYIYRMTAGEYTESRRMLLLR